MPKKGTSTTSKTPSTSVKRSTRIKRDEPKDVQQKTVQGDSSENEETHSSSLPKKRTKHISTVSKKIRVEKALNEDEQQRTEQSYEEENTEDASTIESTETD